jgi:hypothetical protein
VVRIERLVPAPWNPNKQSEKAFDNLVANIQQSGFDESTEVVPLDADHEEMREKYLTADQAADGELYYLIVGGHHRLEAAKVLDMELVDEAAGEIQSVDDLSRLLNELFSKHGDTLEHSYMCFDLARRLTASCRRSASRTISLRDRPVRAARRSSCFSNSGRDES